jgi:lipoprotein-releasing system permease protein
MNSIIPLPALIAIRYLRSKKSNSSISFFSLVSLFGLSLGLASIIVVISVMNGFENEMHRRILGMLPHVSVENLHNQEGTVLDFNNWLEIAATTQEDVLFKDKIQAASPYIYLDGMINKSGLVKGVRVVGIDPAYEKQSTVLDEFIIVGGLNDLRSGTHNLILGSDIARDLGLIVGDNISLVFPMIESEGQRLKVNHFNFLVVGFFDVGAEADGLLAFINIEDAAKVKYQSERIDGFKFKLKDVYSAESLQTPLKNYFSNQFQVNTWVSSYGQLFQTVKIEKVMTASMLMLIVLVAAFNTVSSLSMLVAEKHTSIAVLRTMGFTRNQVLMIFFYQGLLISGAGVLFGLMVGVLLAYYLSDIIFWINSFQIFWIAPLKSEVRMGDVLWISIAAMGISLVSSLIPAFKAASIQPADAVRYH